MADKAFSHEQAKRPPLLTLPPHLTILYPLTFLSSTSFVSLSQPVVMGRRRARVAATVTPLVQALFLSATFFCCCCDGTILDTCLINTPETRFNLLTGGGECLCAAFCRLTTRPIPPLVLCSWKTKEIVCWKRKLPATPRWKPVLTFLFN